MSSKIRVGFVLHLMQVAGAEVLVADTIRHLRDRIEPTIFCLDAIGSIGEELQKQGVRVIAYGRKPGVDLGVSRRMARDISALRIEVVHAHQYTPFFYSALASRFCRPRPHVIFTEHGRHYPDVVPAKRRILNRWIFDRLADEVNAVCQFSADALARQDGFRRGRIQVIPNGIVPEKYAPAGDVQEARRALGLDPARKYVACIARFHPVKDHGTLLTAFAEVARAVPEADLLLAGDGPLRPDLEQQVRGLGLTDRIFFMGVRSDVADILRVVDVFTLTSVSEAASITLLEAMAAGRPVVVTAVGGNPELVRDGVDGLLAPRGDAPAIAACLTRLLRDADLARSLGNAGAAKVRADFRLEHTIERYFELYAAHRAAPTGA